MEIQKKERPEQGSLLDVIAYTHFLESWLQADEYFGDLDDECLQRLYAKWRNDWVASLDQPHCGDCINLPCPCTRCHTEDIIEQAERILKATQKEQQKENK